MQLKALILLILIQIVIKTKQIHLLRRNPGETLEPSRTYSYSYCSRIWPNWQFSNIGPASSQMTRMRMRTRGSRDLEHFRLSGTIWCSNFSNNGSRQMPICGHSYCLTTRNCYVIGEECRRRDDTLFHKKTNQICAPALTIMHAYTYLRIYKVFTVASNHQ